MIIGRGVYSMPEAASLAGINTARVREWFRSRPHSEIGAIFKSDFAEQTSEQVVSFLDLIDVIIAAQFRDHGLSLQTLRKIYSTLQRDYGVEHPFGRKELLTDGKTVFMSGLDSKGRAEVVEVLSRQRMFPRIILPFLKKLEFDSSSRLASKWNIDKGIVLNPEICFGQPIVEDKGIPTFIVAQSVTANGGDQIAVARWYGMTKQQVARAVSFEKKRAA